MKQHPRKHTAAVAQARQTLPKGALQVHADKSPVVRRLAQLAAKSKSTGLLQRMTIAEGKRVNNQWVPRFETTSDFEDNHLIVGNPSRRTSEERALGRDGVFVNTLVNKAEFQKEALARRAEIGANIRTDKVTPLNLPDGAARLVILRHDRTVVRNKKITKIGVQGFKRRSGVTVVSHMTKG